MMLRRGDIAYVAIKGPYTGKPRPVVVIQADEATPFRDSVTVCPLTGDLIDAPVFRIHIAPTSVNGLDRPSDAMADKVVTVPKSALGKRIGKLTTVQLRELDRALRFWLGI
jgi:mRNA interferase MazF